MGSPMDEYLQDDPDPEYYQTDAGSGEMPPLNRCTSRRWRWPHLRCTGAGWPYAHGFRAHRWWGLVWWGRGR